MYDTGPTNQWTYPVHSIFTHFPNLRKFSYRGVPIKLIATGLTLLVTLIRSACILLAYPGRTGNILPGSNHRHYSSVQDEEEFVQL